jgi:hypothetical protein
VGLRTDLDGSGKSRPHWDSILGPCSPQKVAILTELRRPMQGNRLGEDGSTSRIISL